LRGLFFRKQARIEQSFEAFLGCVQRCVELWSTGLLSYLESGPNETFERSHELVSRAESEADKLRRQIERVLYENELMPDSRGDLLKLLESCDKVANRLESVIRNFCLRQPEIPEEIKPSLRELLVPIETCVETLLTAIRLLFTEPRKAKPAVDDVQRLEGECDRVQHDTIRAVYALDIDLARKIQLERTIHDIGSIADRAEATSAVLEIIAIKRTL
jgi:predicted phosphate transport protein (TIGR00153 family)